MQGDYEEDIIAWMDKYKDMFKKYHQVEMKTLRDRNISQV